MKKYSIGISCIGSSIGQSVINSLRLSRLPLITVGFGTNPFGYGAYDCDFYDYTPTIYDKNFVDELIKKCEKYHIDLLIPGLDDEVLIYSQNQNKFRKAGIKIIVSDEKLVSICRNKEQLNNSFNNITKVFVETINKKTILEDVESGKINFPFIAKPRNGFASRGIFVINNKNDLTKIPANHIIQELAIPTKLDPNYHSYMSQISKGYNPQLSEISIQLVYNQEGQLLGKMSSYNKLINGVPIEILPFENEIIWKTINQLTPMFLKLGLKGPLNIQGRITENGLKLFEMNPRFTGITGLRALMGFNEVEACVKEWLGIDKGGNHLTINNNKFGVRQIADKSISIERNKKILRLNEKLNKKTTKTKKIILITGASGYLGQNFINRLSKINHDYEIWVYSSNKSKLKILFSDKASAFYDKSDFDNGSLQFGHIDILLHLGFARLYRGNEQIADSLNFTIDLFTKAAMNYVPTIINISSQSVYGVDSKHLLSESTPVSPSNTYAQAKYSSELFLRSLNRINNQLKYTSIRLCALAGGSGGLVENELISKITKKALNGETIYIIGGDQQIERLDVQDATSALIKLLKANSLNLKPQYNLGSGKIYSLIELTKRIIEIVSRYRKGVKSKVIVKSEKSNKKLGLNSSLFYNDIGWQPKKSIDDTILSLIKYFKNEKLSN